MAAFPIRHSLFRPDPCPAFAIQDCLLTHMWTHVPETLRSGLSRVVGEDKVSDDIRPRVVGIQQNTVQEMIQPGFTLL